MSKLSSEQWRWKLTNKCPRCGRFVLMPTYLAPDGSEVPLSSVFLQPGSYVSAMCPQCRGTWLVYASQQPAPPAEPTIHITESCRTEEPIGDEVRRVDNSACAMAVTKRLRISKRWLQKCEDKASTRAPPPEG
jgi:phage FluMu protein Com